MRLRWAAASSLRQSYEKSLERTPRSRRTKSRKQNGWSLRDIRGERDFWAVLSQLLVVMRAHVGFRSMHDKLRSQYRYISIQVFMKIGHENQHVRFANSFTKCDVDFTGWTHRYAFSRLLEKKTCLVIGKATLPRSQLASSLRGRMNKWLESPPNCERLVLGNVDADFLQTNIRWISLDYQIYILFHRPDQKISTNASNFVDILHVGASIFLTPVFKNMFSAMALFANLCIRCWWH